MILYYLNLKKYKINTQLTWRALDFAIQIDLEQERILIES